MKLSLIAVCMLAVVGCASGEVDPVEDPPVVVVAPKIPKPTAPAVPVEEDTDAAPPIKCVINDYWVGDCHVLKIYCEGKPVQVEVYCGPGRKLWPWEIIPDPPYDHQPGN